MKINFITSATALFVVSIITIPQLVNAQRIVSHTKGVRGLSTNSEEMLDKIMNTIANIHPEDGVDAVDDRMLVVAKEKVDHIMESIDNVKEVVNKHGRHLETSDDTDDLIALLILVLVLIVLIFFQTEFCNQPGPFIDRCDAIFVSIFVLIDIIEDTISVGSNMHGDITDRRVLISKDKVMESKKVKDTLDSLDTDTDMNMFKAVMANANINSNEYGRHLQQLDLDEILFFIASGSALFLTVVDSLSSIICLTYAIILSTTLLRSLPVPLKSLLITLLERKCLADVE